MYSQDNLERFLLLVSAILRQWEMTPVSVAYHFIVSTCNLQEQLFDLEIPQEILYRDSHRQPRL